MNSVPRGASAFSSAPTTSWGWSPPPLQPHVAQGKSHADAPEHDEVHGGRAGLPLEVLCLTAIGHVLVGPAFLRTVVQNGGEEPIKATAIRAPPARSIDFDCPSVLRPVGSDRWRV